MSLTPSGRTISEANVGRGACACRCSSSPSSTQRESRSRPPESPTFKRRHDAHRVHRRRHRARTESTSSISSRKTCRSSRGAVRATWRSFITRARRRLPSACAAQPLPPGIYTNRPEYAPGPPRNIIAILIDSLNTRAEDQVKVLAHILSFVGAVPSDTRVAIYRTGERVHVDSRFHRRSSKASASDC